MTSTWDRSAMKRSGCTLSESSSHLSRSRSSLDITPRCGDTFALCTVRSFLTLESNAKWNHVYNPWDRFKRWISAVDALLSIRLSSPLLGLSQGMWPTVNSERGKKKKSKQRSSFFIDVWNRSCSLWNACVLTWQDSEWNAFLETSVCVVFHTGLCSHELCSEIHS